MTSTERPTQRIQSVDGLRAVAFLAVFAFHTWEFAGRPEIPVLSSVVSQNIRPDFFVVLTGFVLFLPFARRPERMDEFRTRAYVWRRMRRIVIPYYVALAYAVLLPQLLVVIMRLFGREASWQPMPSLGDWLSHLTFSHLFFAEHWSSMNGSLWTMSLEMQLYLLFPLLLIAANRWGARALIIAIVVSVVFRIAVALFVPGEAFPDQFLWSASGLGRLMEFAAGMLAAIVAFKVVERIRRPHIFLLLAVMVVSYLVATAPLFRGTVLPIRELGLSALFGSLIVLVLSVPAIGRMFAWKPLVFIGYRSYSLFLIHQPTAWYVSEFLQKFLDVPEGPLLLLLLWTVGFGVVFAVGQLLFVAVERPCIDWAKRARKPAPAQA
ncbi:acyltransferase [Agromyces sp. SYSU K20354]|uniref:acyltransferase family protein n=1 Tax=Agromyces cavernae TaxID=2898659 RepID=UPI001E3ECD35|nr:acyltransferase [Agromyces cavernae]MCD2441008.1 acyltransferase [Agromyces cavernae]